MNSKKKFLAGNPDGFDRMRWNENERNEKV